VVQGNFPKGANGILTLMMGDFSIKERHKEAEEEGRPFSAVGVEETAC